MKISPKCEKFHHQLASHHREALLLETNCCKEWTVGYLPLEKGKEESRVYSKLDPSLHGMLLSLLVSKDSAY